MSLKPDLLALIKKSKNKHTRTGNSVKLKEGTTQIRILGNGAEQFWRDVAVHWIKTDINGKPVAVVGCRDEIKGEPCEICTAIAQAAAASTSDDETKLIKEWKAKKSVLVIALLRSGPDKLEVPQIVELTPTAWADIAGTLAEYSEAGEDLLDPKTGKDFSVERRGKGLDTTYTVRLSPKSQPVPDGLTLPDMDSYIEGQYFRGDETKALTAIANVTGITIANVTGITIGTSHRLAGPARSSSAMLTKPAARVEDAEVAAAADAVIEAEADVIDDPAADEPAVETDEEREAREFAEFKAAQAAKKAQAAAAAAPPAGAKPAAKPAATAKPAAAKPAAAKPAADEFNSTLEQDEVDSLLAELE